MGHNWIRLVQTAPHRANLLGHDGDVPGVVVTHANRRDDDARGLARDVDHVGAEV